MIVKKFIEFMVLKIKGRTFEIDENVDDLYLINLSLSQLFSLMRGLIKVRKIVFLGQNVKVYGTKKLKIGKGVSISDFCIIDSLSVNGLFLGDGSSIGRFGIVKVSGSLAYIGDNITIGKNVGIGDFCHLGGAGGVSIGDDTIIGAYFSVHPENHIFDDKEILIRNQGVTHQGISIGPNCWIGAKVTVLDGAIIGPRCIVAAGSVVKGSFPEGCVIGGVPARILKEI
ncbi:acyltransferase [Shewanella sp. Arc9-LZ]|uniref:acyltransferase n=1 Tax=Shewanella sp. Arc9-LZ TaxID=2698686 RepID=UPI0015823022|nr:acyltransferase [Shewanella sp. Arc9-LZ]